MFTTVSAASNTVLHIGKLVRMNLKSSHRKKNVFVTLYGDRWYPDLLW